MKFHLDINDPADRKVIRAIAQDVAEIMKQDSRQPQESELSFKLGEVEKITGIKKATLIRHIKNDPPLLIAKKVGKQFIVTQENLNTYTGKNEK